MKDKLTSFVYAVAFIPLLISSDVQATIYKCINLQEQVYYNDKPCPVTNIEKKIRSVKDPENGYIPPPFVEEPTINNKKGIIVGKSTASSVNSNKENASAKNIEGKGDSGSAGNVTSNEADTSNNKRVASANEIAAREAATDTIRTNLPPKPPGRIEDYVTH